VDAQVNDLIKAAAEYVGVPGLLAGGIGGIALLLLALFVKDRINPFKKAKDHFEKGHHHRALSFLAIVLQRQPSNRAALLMRADIERSRGLHEEAEQDYERLIYLKKPGDGIDLLDAKRKLLKPLHAQGKLYETLTTAKEILSQSGSDPDALYYLGLVYLGQLYYKEAWKIFQRLLSARPNMESALFAASVALIQLRDCERAVDLLKKALSRVDEPLYRLLWAGAYYLMGNFKGAGEMLRGIAGAQPAFASKKQLELLMRLAAFSSLGLRNPGGAGKWFAALGKLVEREARPGAGGKLGAGRREADGPARRAGAEFLKMAGARLGKGGVQKMTGVYNQFGKLEAEKPKERACETQGLRDTGNRAGRGRDTAEGPPLADFYRMKEVFREEGRWPVKTGEIETSGGSLLDIEGLSRRTWALLDIGLNLVRENRLERARGLFEEMSRTCPEVLGVKKLVDLLGESEKPPGVPDTAGPGGARNPQSARDGRGPSPGGAHVSERTRRVLERGKRRYELRDYLEAWEQNGVRPYHLMMASGLAARSRLDPRLLFTADGRFALDF